MTKAGAVSASLLSKRKLDIYEQKKPLAGRLPRLNKPCIHGRMKRFFDMDDRARLRERFFGATLTVLARLS
ncbi:MAG: hypothetical protein HKP37_06230 [Boseongicola sp.]|nr:hypothetical protein [Boseongicola sp.]